MGQERVFILGVGAQKCGTSWLHSYLNSFPNADFGPIKEYHIWDAKLFPYRLVTEEQLLEKRNERVIHHLRLRYALQKIDGAYEAFFTSPTMPGKAQITGDISPSYSALSEDVLLDIRSRLEKCGFLVKVVFLLRDPVERIWSKVRMNRRDRVKLGKDPARFDTEANELRKVYAHRETVLRSSYDQTVKALSSVFESDSLYFGIYEELFTEESIRSLSKFCGVEPKLEYAKYKVNAADKTGQIPPKLRQEITEYYAKIYDFCFDRFPATRNLWQKS